MRAAGYMIRIILSFNPRAAINMIDADFAHHKMHPNDNKYPRVPCNGKNTPTPANSTIGSKQ